VSRASQPGRVICAAGVALLVGAAGCRAGARPVAPPPEAVAPPPEAAVSSPETTPTPPPPPAVAVAAADGFGETRRQLLLELAADPARRLEPSEVGYYMDVQQARLQQLAETRLRVERDESRLVVTLVGGPAFESGSSRLTPDTDATLRMLAATLTEYAKTLVSVHGHTDASGDEAANLQLSTRRAMEVAQALIARGVTADRLLVVGHGQSVPIASNDTVEGRERNRRVELHVDPIQR